MKKIKGISEADVIFMVIAPYIMHQCWVSYQMGCGQKYNVVPTEWQIASLVDACLSFRRNPFLTAKQNHKLWMDYKLSKGWKYGKKKDVKKKTHYCLVPYSKLPKVEKQKDVMDIEARRCAMMLAKKLSKR